MKKQLLNKMSVWFTAFLVLALAFLAVGLGTLGSAQSTGGAYALNAQAPGDGKLPSIILHVTDPLAVGTTSERELYIRDVYLNIGTVYEDLGTAATVSLGRGNSASAGFYNDETIKFANMYAEEGSDALTDGLFNWVKFPIEDGEWKLGNYHYFRLSSKGGNFLINEIVFVAYEKNGTEPVLLNAEVDKASNLPYDTDKGETAEAALARAQAILDRQRIPNPAQSSYYRFGREEVYTLMTVSEMKLGGSYRADNIYHGEKVFNSLGTDLMALGTAIFGISPFGLRFMPFLASFGVLIVGYLLIKRMTESEKAGFVFALVYVLSGLAFGLGHLGTPLMIGIFFLLTAFFFCFNFYKEGMKRADLVSALPLALGGLFGAAAICVHGALLIPVLGLVALVIAGLVRQRNAGRAELETAIDEAEAEEAGGAASSEEDGEPKLSGRKRVGLLLAENRFKLTVPAVLFFAFLVVGTLLMAMLSSLPLYYVYVKIYDNPASPQKSVFAFLWQAFAGGFAGVNEIGVSRSAWNFFYELFRGTGSVYGVTGTGTAVALAAIVAGLAGVGYLIAALVRRAGSDGFKEVLKTALPLAVGAVLSLVTAAFASGGLLFLSLAYLFLFALAAVAAGDAEREGGKTAALVNKISILLLVLLVVFFALFAVFTFSIPTAGFLSGLYA